MSRVSINIINPKANRFLKLLVDINFISIEKKENKTFESVVKKIRSKNYPPMSLKEITKQVEAVRKKRYER